MLFPEKQKHDTPRQLIGPALMLAHGIIKCPICETYYFHSKDLKNHLETHWKTTKNNNGEWMPANPNLPLTQQLKTVGTMIENGYRYNLIYDGQVIIRKKQHD